MSRSLPLRRTALTLAIATAAAVLAPVSAMAVAPLTTPTITAPMDGATVVTKDVTVSATSDATHVRFVLGSLTGAYDQLVAVSGGTATAQFSLLGFAGNTTIEAFDCDDLGACNTAGPASLSVIVDLTDPVITDPTNNNKVVGSSVTVKVDAPGPAVQFLVDGSPAGKDLSTPIQKDVSLRGVNDGTHTITARQCNADGTICDGDEGSVDVLKDTKGPRWSDLSTSLRTVFPIKDHYKDSTVLSARVSEKSFNSQIQIRRAGGPLVRTIRLGRVDPGKVRATWNGRKSNGDLVPGGKYLFRFVGTDTNGVVGKSGDKPVYVSDKKLVKKTVSKTMGALASGAEDDSGRCSDVVGIRYLKGYGRDWPGGLQWRSNVRRNCSGDASIALSAHVARAEKAIRYGSLQISAYGGGALTRGGPAKIIYIRDNSTVGAAQTLSSALGWHKGDRVPLASYLFGSKLLWFVGTANGNWYDIKEFRVTYSVWVLRS